MGQKCGEGPAKIVTRGQRAPYGAKDYHMGQKKVQIYGFCPTTNIMIMLEGPEIKNTEKINIQYIMLLDSHRIVMCSHVFRFVLFISDAANRLH